MSSLRTSSNSSFHHHILNRQEEEEERRKFPEKLHDLLEMASSNPELSSIVSWLPDGRSFNVHDHVSFTDVILPEYFSGMKHYRSFRRQLNLYGITKKKDSEIAARLPTADHHHPRTAGIVAGHQDERTTTSLASSFYAHPKLQRGRRDLAETMRRLPSPSVRPRASSTTSSSSSNNGKSNEACSSCCRVAGMPAPTQGGRQGDYCICNRRTAKGKLADKSLMDRMLDVEDVEESHRHHPSVVVVGHDYRAGPSTIPAPAFRPTSPADRGANQPDYDADVKIFPRAFFSAERPPPCPSWGGGNAALSDTGVAITSSSTVGGGFLLRPAERSVHQRFNISALDVQQEIINTFCQPHHLASSQK